MWDKSKFKDLEKNVLILNLDSTMSYFLHKRMLDIFRFCVKIYRGQCAEYCYIFVSLISAYTVAQ